MAWEWSHTDGAYADARANVERLPRADLLTILREWSYYDREQRSNRDSRYRFPRTIRGQFRLPTGVRQLSRDTLADLVWERMEEYRTCTNGGWEAYCCPDGCHIVPFATERHKLEAR